MIDGGFQRRAPTRTMGLAFETLQELNDADASMPRLGLFYGKPGLGKSHSVGFSGSQFDAVYIVARSIWTQRSLLENIAMWSGI